MELQSEILKRPPIEPIQLELGVDIVRSDFSDDSKSFVDRLKPMKRKIALKLGITEPTIRIIDNSDLPPSKYVIKVTDSTVESGFLPKSKLLVLYTKPTLQVFPGELVSDPIFGYEHAQWIDFSAESQARALGISVYDSSTILLTHLDKVMKLHAHLLLTRSSVIDLIERMRDYDRSLYHEIMAQYGIDEVQSVLRGLLQRGLCIRNLAFIFEEMYKHRQLSIQEIVEKLIEQQGISQ